MDLVRPDDHSSDGSLENLLVEDFVDPLLDFDLLRGRWSHQRMSDPFDSSSSVEETSSVSDGSEYGKVEEKIWNLPHVRNKCISFYSKINEYFDAGEYTDVNIICQKRVFKCHRIVLASSSEYFHLMFGGSFRERNDTDVVLHDIDSVTFEQILRSIYTGDVGVVDDDNVYHLLRASEMLVLKNVENRCVNYLIHRKIPMEYALDIFLFAHVTGKELLIPVASRFILKLMMNFRADNSLLRISFDELNTLLRYSSYISSSENNEKALLKMIRRWTLHSTDSREDQRSNFLKLTQNIEFKHISNIEEYFDEDTAHSSSENSPEDAFSIDGLDSQIGYKKPSFLLYVNGFDPTIKKYESYHSRLEKDDAALNWSRVCVSKYPVDQIRTVVLNERLYSLKSHQCWLRFDVCSLTDSFPARSLVSPSDSEHYSGGPYFICHDDDTIYFLDWNHNLFAYDDRLDGWMTILNLLRPRFLPAMMTCHERRLFLMGTKPHLKHPRGIRDTAHVDALRAYDRRVGKLEKLPSCKNPHSLYNDECCSYNGRIYVTHGEKRKTFMLDVYDPRAGKWDIILRRAKKVHNLSFFHRLLSFDSRLWMFYSESKETISYETFDSFLEEWSMETPLNHVFENKECLRIMDAVVVHE